MLLEDGITSLTAPYTTFFSGGKFAPRSQAMDQNLEDIIRSQIATTGKGSGIIGYSDFDKSQTPGTEFPDATAMAKNLATLKMSPAEFANATTLGRLTYDVDPDTGKVNFGSNVYDFRPEVADQDGVFGIFARKANERAREINPNITVPVDELRGFGRDFSMFDQARMGGTTQPPSFRSLNDPEVYGELDEEKNLLQRILEFAPFGEKSLSGILMRGLGKARSGLANLRDRIGTRLGPERFGTSQAAFNALTPSQQRYVASIYGQGGIMQGYNPVSAFGRGPAGALQNRLDKILAREAAGKKVGLTNKARIIAALDQLGGSDSGDYGPSGYEGMSDAQSAQERSEGGRGSRR